METSVDNLRLILGLKLKNLRQERGASLKEIAQRAGVSISYLSEIEKGKKYPSPDKLLGLAEAFNVTYDDLVSLNVDDKLDPLKEMFSSPFIGIAVGAVFGLIGGAIGGAIGAALFKKGGPDPTPREAGL